MSGRGRIGAAGALAVVLAVAVVLLVPKGPASLRTATPGRPPAAEARGPVELAASTSLDGIEETASDGARVPAPAFSSAAEPDAPLGGALRGVVVDAESGAPIPRFRAEVRRPDGTRALEWEGESAEGTFELGPLPVGYGTLVVEASGHLRGRIGGFQVEAGADLPPVRLRLRRGGTVAGRVVESASARPVAGARIGLRTWEGHELLDQLARGTASAPDGSFELDGVPPTPPTTLWVEAEGYAPQRVELPRVVDGAVGDGNSLWIELVAPGRIEGRIFAPRRGPPRSVWVMSMDRFGTPISAAFDHTVGTEFSVGGLAAGPYAVIAQWVDDGPSLQAYVIVQGGETSIVQLRGLARLYGVVRRGEQPVADVGLALWDARALATWGRGTVPPLATVRTEPDGTYSIDGIGGGPVRLERVTGWAAAETTVADESDERLDLEIGTASVSGTVTDASGTPLRVAVTFEWSGWCTSVLTDADGRYAIVDLPSGPLDHRAVTRRPAGQGGWVREAGRIALAPGETRTLDYRLQLGGSIDLRVIDPLGRTMPCLDYTARRVDLDPYRGPSWDGETGTVLSGVEPGEYRVFVQGPDGTPFAVGPETVRAGETTRFELALD